MTAIHGKLVPELGVSDWTASVRFYRDVLGFRVRYERPEEGFAYLALGVAEIMIDQLDRGRTFDDGHRPAAHPFGRGVNLQIEVDGIAPLVTSLARAGWPLYLDVEERWYRRDDVEVGNRQFAVADPDGYLLRFFENMGERSPRDQTAGDPANTEGLLQ